MRELSDLDELVLIVLRRQSGPAGSRGITRDLSEQGHSVSESTINRLLTGLDGRGYTAPIGNKGRILTAEGRRAAEVLVLNRHRDTSLERALDVRSIADLVDHLTARRGIEREAARAAALRATDEEIALLHRLAQPIDSPLDDRLSFHRAVGDASHNVQIQAIANTLFIGRLDPLESVVLTIGLRSGVHDDWVADHREVAARIADRDADGAEAAMVRHLDATIRETEAVEHRSWGAEVLQQLADTAVPRTDAPRIRTR